MTTASANRPVKAPLAWDDPQLGRILRKIAQAKAAGKTNRAAGAAAGVGQRTVETYSSHPEMKAAIAAIMQERRAASVAPAAAEETPAAAPEDDGQPLPTPVPPAEDDEDEDD